MSEVDNIPGLKIEANDDGTYTLEQEWTGNVDRVAVHEIHIRFLAETMGLLEKPSVQSRTECAIGIAELKRENDSLKRNLLRLRDHALALQHDFATGADWAHADLAAPMEQINALASLFDMACDGFAGDDPCHTTSRQSVGTECPSSLRSPATPANPSPKATSKASEQLGLLPEGDAL